MQKGDVRNMKSVSIAFKKYRDEFPARKPELSRLNSQDELREITPLEGLRQLRNAPERDVQTGAPPRARDEAIHSKYLWAVITDSVPFALEHGENRTCLSRGYLSHTNLTGGMQAHAGGEMWFVDSSTLIFNGASSRYQPRSLCELDSIALAFKKCCYRVAHMGWDDDSGKPARILRGDPQWQ